MDQFFLDQLPQGVILAKGEVITGYNKKAAHCFPDLTRDTDSGWLQRTFPQENGVLSLFFQQMLFTKVTKGEETMITLTPQPEQELSPEQVWRIFYLMRDSLSDMDLKMQTLSTLDKDPRRKILVEELSQEEEAQLYPQVQAQRRSSQEGFHQWEEEVLQARSSLYRTLTKLHRLIDNGELLQLEELDIPLAPLDLAGLCRQLCQEVAPLFATLDVPLDSQNIPVTTLIEGNTHYLRKVLLGLLANYAREKQPIQLSLATRQFTAIITLKNQATTPLDLPIGEILAGNHPGMTPKPGSGAGLSFPAITRIINTMKGTIMAETGATGGLELTISFPMAKQRPMQFSSNARRFPKVAPVDTSGGISDLLLELSPVLGVEFFSPLVMEE